MESVSSKQGFNPSVDYLDWSNWIEVVRRAKIFFEDGAPFSYLSDNQRQLLKDSVIIRNRVAHSSYKCRRAFNGLARRYLGFRSDESLPKGFSVGRLLLSNKVRGFSKDDKSDNYYQSFSVFFHKLADIMAP